MAKKSVNITEIGVILLLYGLSDIKIWSILRRLKMEFGGWKLGISLKSSPTYNIAFLPVMNEMLNDEKILFTLLE
jgi:hypothetical protein